MFGRKARQFRVGSVIVNFDNVLNIMKMKEGDGYCIQVVATLATFTCKIFGVTNPLTSEEADQILDDIWGKVQ